ncbi:MAG: site-specific integrase [Proteobacteria bacterium]|nr:site-specific integrase [Pseudomonadota bacterium]
MEQISHFLLPGRFRGSNKCIEEMPRLSKKTVDACVPKDREYFVWDEDMPGFGLRVFPSGKKSYVLQYRHLGRTRRYAIGLHGKVTPEKAREKAIKLSGVIVDGRDPSAERRRLHQEIDVAALCKAYLKEGCQNKKASTLATDKGRIERHIIPLLGKLRVSSVTSGDVSRFVNDVMSGKTSGDFKGGPRSIARVRGGKGAAARTTGLLGGIFTFAKQQKLIEHNPVHGVARPKDVERSRVLQQEEIVRLGIILEAEDKINPMAKRAVWLLILTGCRKSEILSLKWEHVDFDKGLFQLPDSKTGAKVVVVGKPAIALLKSIPREVGNPYVLPATRGTGHYTGLQKDWEKIRKKAAIEDVDIHDLRRTFGSVGVSDGASLHNVGKLLGHKDPRTTMVYAHLNDSAMRSTAEETSFLIWKALNGED